MRRWTIAMLVLFAVLGCGGGGGSSGPAVTISASTPYASEPSTSGAFTVTRAGDTTDALVVNYTVSGTATNGTDYSLLSGSCTIDAGNSTAVIDVAPIDDAIAEADETVIVTITTGTDYGVGSPGSATVTILDDDSTPTVTIVASDPNAAEPSDHGAFTVTRTGTRVAALTVNYTVSGTATNGTDYSLLSGSCVIDVGSGTALMDVAPIDDPVWESDETVVLTLTAGGYSIGLPASATVIISNDDPIHVDPTGSGTDGVTWATAFHTVQEAVNFLSGLGGGEVWVAAAMYNTGSPILAMKPNVHIYGGFEGYAGGSGAQETSLPQRNFASNVTILDGGDTVRVVVGADNATLDGFTIKRGYDGGGMYNYHVSPTVANCIFNDNYSYNGGGGILNWTSSPIVTNCTFSGNSATDGGGMANYEASFPTVTNCTFSGNLTPNYGGGMFNLSSSPIVTNCTFSGNSATTSGGGMSNWSSSPTVTNCTFATNSAGTGGGMSNWSSPLLFVKNCILWGDSAPTGPEIYNSAATPRVTYCDVQGGYTGIANINANPLFVGGTLRLQASSPCRDTGYTAALPPDTSDLDNDGNTTEPIPYDLDNEPRVVGSAVDMGAYEY